MIEFLILLFAAWFAYMSFHVIEEERRGEYIRLPWEKKDD